tara:strand:+ start:966 stop:2189 length:1224 start_codon:yes stop_codon:yes gene_type:complete
MKINLFNTLNIYQNLFQEDENKRIINIYKLNSVILTGNNIFYPNVLLKTHDDLILPILEKTMSLKQSTNENMSFNYKEIQINNNIDTPVFFFIYNTNNYFHFLYDTLPYLISYFKLKKDIPDIKLLMQYPNPQKLSMFKFVLEFLEILNIHQNQIIMASENTLYKDLYISTSYTHDFDSNLPPRKEIFDFFYNMVQIVKKNNSLNTIPKKIYVSRRSWLHNDFSNIGTNYTTRRKCMNEDQLVDILLKNGYTEVFTENLSTIQKILYFSNATNVVGAIGGGISNVLFSPKTTKLNAIVSPTFLDVNKRFKFCLDNVDVNYDFNTLHYEQKLIKKYMRVKTKDGNITGEIQEIDGDNIIVFINNNETGWDLQNNYEQKKLHINDVINIDNGLNSSWIYMLDNDNKYLF